MDEHFRGHKLEVYKPMEFAHGTLTHRHPAGDQDSGVQRLAPCSGHATATGLIGRAEARGDAVVGRIIESGIINLSLPTRESSSSNAHYNTALPVLIALR
ncbi:hypothetical protein PGTUg99_028119 [Puccinia graminis f. sp. tritici]|uniref:Uncharacterized protein n=1 Tax=Puccinia graminis f. sp. tritici TaxID=56615 RepID=A0A5B0SIJ8_PUCGR|nr:hypothetical protein PGTUg99_028119 [Puccinia graminis f. sp. tritici]